MVIFTPNTVIRSTEINSNFADSIDLGKHTNNYTFMAYVNTAFNTTAGAWATLRCNAEVYDTNSNYDTTNYAYTAPVSGIYNFSVTALFFSQPGTPVLIGLGKNWTSGDETYRLGEIPNCGGNTTISGSTDVKLVAGDVVKPLQYAQGTLAVGTTARLARFSGHFVGIA